MPTTKTSSSKAAKKSSASGRAAGNTQLEKFFIDSLKDIYWAEKHLTKALPKMQKAATTEELQNAIGEHISQTEEHVARLEHVFEMMGHKAQAKKCEAMEGLIAEGQEILEDTEEDSMVRDAGIIIASQKIEHYEIAAYGSAAALAGQLEFREDQNLLHESLEEEKATDAMLTTLAKGEVNLDALAA